MRHELPKLPFPFNALAPLMSRETLEYHYGKHHRGYVEKLNELIVGTPFWDQSLVEIVRGSSGPIFNNAGQAWNHEFFWRCLSPDRAPISPTLRARIAADFGALDAFEQELLDKGTELFGSGWLWLIEVEGKLEWKALPNADTPVKSGKHPLLACDLWEHAYYIDYRDGRPKFLEAFYKLVNWEFVENRLASAVARAA